MNQLTNNSQTLLTMHISKLSLIVALFFFCANANLQAQENSEQNLNQDQNQSQPDTDDAKQDNSFYSTDAPSSAGTIDLMEGTATGRGLFRNGGLFRPRTVSKNQKVERKSGGWNDQDEFQLLSGKKNKGFGIYGSLLLGSSPISKTNTVMTGAKIAFVINHSFAIGFGGYGLAGHARPSDNPTGVTDAIVSGGFGGIYLEPILFPKKAVHVTFPVLIGAGAVGYYNYQDEVPFDEWEEWDDDYDQFTGAFIVEPAVNVELNVARRVRLGAQFSYRFSNDIDVGQLADQNLNNWGAGINLKFGRF